MATWTERFPFAFEEWCDAGGVENNFRAHALAIGLQLPGRDDLTFIDSQVKTALRQGEEVHARFNATYPSPDPAPAPTGRAADISYLTGEIDQAFCTMLKGLGVDLVIVGLQDLALANSQLSVVLAAGLRIHAYIWPQNKDLATYLPEVYSIMAYFKVPCIWVDVEDSEVNIKQAVVQLREHTEFVTGIYTSPYMWKRWMNNTVTYSHLPLWYACYDRQANMADFEPFAGWKVPVAKQYNADSPRYDLDVYTPDLMP